MATDFTPGWSLTQVLGEGAFGEVKLLVNKKNGEVCAMKEIDLDSCAEAEEATRKEVVVHGLLRHRHVVQCYGSRSEGRRKYIFLEYCGGGELFDQIEPDVGMAEGKAQMFFKQLISGVEYLHRKGVTHRDIKPENLLLMDDQKTLKISDFGLSTVFRHGGRERLLERRCGSLPYMAPEVLAGGQYSAEPGDVWSCGLVLVALLAGELPWARPDIHLREFRDWVSMDYSVSPWSKIGSLALSLLRKVIMPQPARRYTVGQIKEHIWMKKDFQDEARVQSWGGRKSIDQEPCASLSQPLPDQGPSQGPAGDSAGWRGLTSSQPALLEAMAGGGRVRRLTRLWVRGDRAAVERELRSCLGREGCSCKVVTPGVLTAVTTDRRGGSLVLKAAIVEVDRKVLLDFRLSRGDGLEFKRLFCRLAERLEPLAL